MNECLYVPVAFHDYILFLALSNLGEVNLFYCNFIEQELGQNPM